MSAYLLTGGRVLLPEGFEEVDIRVEGGAIVEIGSPPRDGATTLDMRGLTVAPALIDIHGDAFERQMMPRPGVFFPMDVAVMDTDRQLAAAGLATAYHALTLSWEPGLRAVSRGEDFVTALETHAPRLAVDHRIQLRWETFAFEALPLIEHVLSGDRRPAIAFNDHTSMGMRSIDMPVRDRLFEQSPDYALASFDDPRLRERHAAHAKRAGMELDAYMDLLASIWERRSEVDAMIRRVAEMGRKAGAPMLSHDDTQHETRAYYRGVGAEIAEFPMVEPVAREAKAAGEAVVLGAPNVLRGGSHIGSLSAAEMIEEGVCDILASDYAYPAMLGAVGRLAAERRAPLERIWACVSTNPAKALKLEDRGEIRVGQRADLVAVDWPEGGTPAAKLTLAGGRIAHLAADLVR